MGVFVDHVLTYTFFSFHFLEMTATRTARRFGNAGVIDQPNNSFLCGVMGVLVSHARLPIAGQGPAIASQRFQLPPNVVKDA
jgi:hypothetical protein